MPLTKFFKKIASPDVVAQLNKPTTVLLVDDQPEVAEVTQDLLRAKGYTVVAKSSAAAALDALATNPDIDIVVSDIVMPGELGGADIAEFAKEMAGLRTILISGFPHHQITIDSLGKYDVVLKPFLIEELDDHIQAALARD
ncbi:response regulator [Parasphingopyxis sp.]|uniref:response regulator n=1 Tax=Parasphingopyxis sp. TaxID=1920299 RepID=UPI00260AC649|nr:response regulator [Parasphingopyxis sp.]